MFSSSKIDKEQLYFKTPKGCLHPLITTTPLHPFYCKNCFLATQMFTREESFIKDVQNGNSSLVLNLEHNHQDAIQQNTHYPP